VKPYRLHRLAQAEFLAAVRWYAARSPAAARRFVQAVHDGLVAVAEAPEAWPQRGLRADVRTLVLARFPFSIVYRDDAAEIRVLAIAHAKRRPGYWTRR
jgi:toxin ParE1/3/4